MIAVLFMAATWMPPLTRGDCVDVPEKRISICLLEDGSLAQYWRPPISKWQEWENNCLGTEDPRECPREPLPRRKEYLGSVHGQCPEGWAAQLETKLSGQRQVVCWRYSKGWDGPALGAKK